MLRISKLQAPAAARGKGPEAEAARVRAAKYYTRYYSPGTVPGEAHCGTSPAQWLGGQAEAMDLSGAVSTEQMERLLGWQDPRTGEVLAPQRADAVWAFDGTFSTPKSVSILWALEVDPDRQAAIQAAHDAAVKAAIALLEPEIARLRRGSAKRGTLHQVRAESGILAVVAAHQTARPVDGRAPDPQLHSHVVLSAILPGAEDGNWTSLDASDLFLAARMGGAAYQQALRAELSRTLGVRWGPVTAGIAEVVGIDADLRDGFSARAKELRAVARDPSDAASRQAAATSTRSGKEHGDPAALRPQWIARARELGVDPSEILVQVASAEVLETGPTARELLEADPAAVLRKPGWTPRDLIFAGLAADVPADEVQGWADGILGGAALWEDLDLSDLPALRAQLDGVALVRLREPNARHIEAEIAKLRADLPEGEEIAPEEIAAIRERWADPVSAREAAVFASAGTVIAEAEVLQIALDGVDAGRGVATPRAIEAATKKFTVALEKQGHSPSEDQLAAIQEIAQGGHTITSLVGHAGASKTSTLAAVASAMRRSSIQIRGCSVAAKAVHGLQAATDIESQTVASILAALDRGEQLETGLVLVVDEAGMLSTQDLARLAAAIEAAKGKLVLVGDPKQLASVGHGGLLGELEEQLPETVATLTTVHRHADSHLARVAADWRLGLGEQAVAGLVARGAIQVHDNHDETLVGLASVYRSALVAGRAARPGVPDAQLATMMTARRTDAQALARLARAAAREAGELDGEDVAVDADLALAGGDQIVLRAAFSVEQEVERGAKGTVTRVTRQGVDILFADGTRGRVSAAALHKGHLRPTASIATLRAGLTLQPPTEVDGPDRWAVGSLVQTTAVVRGARGDAVGETVKTAMREAARAAHAAGKSKRAVDLAVAKAAAKAADRAGRVARGTGGSVIARVGGMATVRDLDGTEVQVPADELRAHLELHPLAEVVARSGGRAVVRDADDRTFEVADADLARGASPDLLVGMTVQATTDVVVRRKITNGETAVVESIDTETGARLAMADGSQVTLPVSRLAQKAGDQRTVELAAASTIHLAQGVTVDHAFVLADGLGSASGAYVALSRERHSLTIGATAGSVAAAAIALATVTQAVDEASVTAHARSRGEGQSTRSDPRAAAAAWAAAAQAAAAGPQRRAVQEVADAAAAALPQPSAVVRKGAARAA